MNYLNVYAVFFNVREAPGRYIVRRYESEPPAGVITDDYYISSDLDAIRNWIRGFSAHKGMLADVRFPRQPEDPPGLIETWI